MSKVNLKDLLPETNYVLRVRAVGPSGKSPWSTKFNFRTIDDDASPETVSSLTWVTVGDSFHGEWNAVSVDTNGHLRNAVRYDVELTWTGQKKYVSVVAPGAGEKVIFDLPITLNRALFGIARAMIGIRVRAVDSRDNKGEWFPATPLFAVNNPPSAPTNVTAEAGLDMIIVRWTPAGNNDIIGYNIYHGAENTLVGFVDGNTYTYYTSTYGPQTLKVASLDKFGQTSELVAANTVTPISPFLIDIEPPDTPSITSATITNSANGASATLDVAWSMGNLPPDMAGYHVRFRKVGSTFWSQAGATKDDTTISIPFVAPYVAYEVQIRGVDQSANYSAWSSTTTSAAAVNNPPGTVATITATPGKDSITYNWTALPDTDIRNYEVTVSTSATFASGNVIFNNGTSTNLTVSGLSPSTPYYARVRAQDYGGLPSAAFSATNTSSTTASAGPQTDGRPPQSSPTPTISSGLGYLYAIWSPVTLNSAGGAQVDQVTYEVHLSTTSNFTPSAATLCTITTGTFALLDLLPGTSTPLSYNTTYYVRLIAKDGDGAAAVGAQGSNAPAQIVAADSALTAANVGAPSNSEFLTAQSTGVNILTGGNVERNTTRFYELPVYSTLKDYVGRKITLSFDMKADISRPINIYPYQNSGISIENSINISPTTTYQRYYFTTTVYQWTAVPNPTQPRTDGGIGFYDTVGTQNISIKNFKIEFGASGSAWTPSAQDGLNAAGESIKSYANEYYLSTSESTQTGGTWTSTPPVRTAGTFIWERTNVVYQNLTTAQTPAVLVTGNAGSQGNPGTPAATIDLTATSQSLIVPAAGGATTPATTTVTGTASNTTISTWQVSVDGAAFVNDTTPPAGYSRTGNVVTITGATMTSRTIAVRMGNGATVNDTLTVARVLDGVDAHTILLTNESHTFPGNTTSANAGSTTTDIIAYRGAVQKAATIGTIVGQVTGLTTAITSNGTTAPRITVTVSTALVAQNGVLTVPVTVDGILYNKSFSWAVTRTGAQGTSVQTITPYYLQNAFGVGFPAKPTASTPPGWTSTEPGYVPDTELYRTDRIQLSDTTFGYSDVSKVSAYTASNSAMVTANGKNKITHSTAVPGVTANSLGDTWIQIDNVTDRRIIAQFRGMGGTAWESETIRSEFIAYLDAEKISANSTFTNNLNVKSTFTLGASGVTGAIKSWDYAAGTTGFIMSSAGLEINQGIVRAKALNVNVGGSNLLKNSSGEALPLEWAPGNASTMTQDTSVPPFRGTKVVKFTNSNSVNPEFYFTLAGIANMVPVQANGVYTFSVYARSSKASLAAQIYMYWYDAAGALISNQGINVPSPLTTTFVRVSGTFNAAPANAAYGRPSYYITGGAVAADSFFFDAAQLELGDVLTAYAPKTDEILPGTITGEMLNTNLAVVNKTLTLGQDIVNPGNIKSYDYSPGVSGFNMSSAGLEINKGTVRASALNVSLGGENVVPDSSFDIPGTAYISSLTTITSGTPRSSGTSIGLQRTSPTGDAYILTHNEMIPLSKYQGKRMMFSWYARATATVNVDTPAIQSTPYVAATIGVSQAFTVTTTWTRFIGYVDVPSGMADGHLVFRPPNDTTTVVYYDDVQLEVGDIATAYSPKTSEILPGSITGEMLNTNFAVVNKTLTLGIDASNPGIIKSYNYSNPSRTGFSISSSGLEIWNGKISAALLETGTTITGNLSVTGVLEVVASGAIKSTNFNGVDAGYRIQPNGIEMLDANSVIRANAIKAGTLGGINGSGIINIGFGTSMIFNGGYLKSNTNTGTTLTSAIASGQGFYLDQDGLFIGGGPTGGRIKANAIESDTLETTTITLGNGGVIQAAGWQLNQYGLTIPTGAIQAGSINITSEFGNSATSIDGSVITTGSLVSNTLATDRYGNPIQGRLAWQLAKNGYATFGGVQLYGNMVVGYLGDDPNLSAIQSGNYGPGSAGWRIDNTKAEFNNVVIRGHAAFGNEIVGPSFRTQEDAFTAGITINYQNSKEIIAYNGNNARFFYLHPNGIDLSGTVNFHGSPGTTTPGVVTFQSTQGTHFRGPVEYYGVNQATVKFNNGFTVTDGDVRLDFGASTVYLKNAILSGTNSSLTGSGSINISSAIRSRGDGIFMEDLAGGGLTTAGINNFGRITRASNGSYTVSSIQFKKNVETLTLQQARGVLNLRSVTFQDTREEEYEVSPRVAGFIAEEAAETGTADFWVGYNPTTGKPGGFRYDKMSAAHNVLIQDHDKRIRELEQQVMWLKLMMETPPE